ncbi:MAG: hypothetical protein DSY85_03170 [Marinomonas sp.]|nr:MAG: hypothetical protein DSY85_03170 [Marinomonas sp.]
MYKIGYLFKPTHTDIHYVRQPSRVDLRRRYEVNFTTNGRFANTVTDIDTAKELIVKIVDRFKKNDGYQYTPVLINTETGRYERYINNHDPILKSGWLGDLYDLQTHKRIISLGDSWEPELIDMTDTANW